MTNANTEGQPVLALHVVLGPALAHDAHVPVPHGGETVSLPVALIDRDQVCRHTGTIKGRRNMLVGTVDGLKAHLAEAVDTLVAFLAENPQLAAASAEAIDLLGLRERITPTGAILVNYAVDGAGDGDGGDGTGPATLPMVGGSAPVPAAGRDEALATIGSVLDGFVGLAVSDAVREATAWHDAHLREAMRERDLSNGFLEAAQAALVAAEAAKAEAEATLGAEISRLGTELEAKCAECQELVRSRGAAAEVASSVTASLVELKQRALVGDDTVDELIRRVAVRLPGNYRIRLRTYRRTFPAADGSRARAYYVVERKQFGGRWRQVVEYSANYGSWDGDSAAIARLKKEAGGLPWQ